MLLQLSNCRKLETIQDFCTCVSVTKLVFFITDTPDSLAVLRNGSIKVNFLSLMASKSTKVSPRTLLSFDAFEKLF
jgi:hypothetical protein